MSFWVFYGTAGKRQWAVHWLSTRIPTNTWELALLFTFSLPVVTNLSSSPRTRVYKFCLCQPSLLIRRPSRKSWSIFWRHQIAAYLKLPDLCKPFLCIEPIIREVYLHQLIRSIWNSQSFLYWILRSLRKVGNQVKWRLMKFRVSLKHDPRKSSLRKRNWLCCMNSRSRNKRAVAR